MSAKKYDVIVIGAGSGLDVVSFAASHGLKVALIEEGPLGGTCLNRGCIPSKMLLHAADVAETIKTSKQFGIEANITSIHFAKLVRNVSAYVDDQAEEIAADVATNPNITWYKSRAVFTSPKVLYVNNHIITADKIIIAGGARPAIPPIDGLDEAMYITSTEALRLQSQPRHLVIVGGGFIAAELAHFFNALGTKVTILARENQLLSHEDTEIAAWFGREFEQKIDVRHNKEVLRAEKQSKGVKLHLRDGLTVTAEKLLIATGITPNADILQAQAGGIALTQSGYIQTNNFFATNIDGVYAFGDIIGKLPLKHAANNQVTAVIRNVFKGERQTVDYHTIPHALFSSPQVAGVGYTEQQLQKLEIPYRAGRYELKDTAMGAALQQNGLVKVLVGEDGSVLGGHIVGPNATILIHEIVLAMKQKHGLQTVTNAVFAHPALSEWVQRAFLSVR